MRNPVYVDNFGTLTESETKLQKATYTWWYNKIILPILTIAFSALDGVTLYPVFESIFAESPLLLYVTTFGTALCLNFIPLVSARLLLKYKYGMGEKNLVPFIVLMVVYTMLLASVCSLRLATRNEVIGNLSDSIQSSAGADLSSGGVPGSLTMIIVQCVTNLVTSVIAFFLSYLSEDPLQMEINAIKLQIARQEEHLKALLTVLPVFEGFDYNQAVQDEEDKFKSAVIALAERRDLLKAQSDLQLEMICANPDAISYITEAGQDELGTETNVPDPAPEPETANTLPEDAAPDPGTDDPTIHSFNTHKFG